MADRPHPLSRPLSSLHRLGGPHSSRAHRSTRVVPQAAASVILMAVGALGSSGCISVRTEPIKVEPIHVTVDVNVRVQREVDELFRPIDEANPLLNVEETDQASATGSNAGNGQGGADDGTGRAPESDDPGAIEGL